MLRSVRSFFLNGIWGTLGLCSGRNICMTPQGSNLKHPTVGVQHGFDVEDALLGCILDLQISKD